MNLIDAVIKNDGNLVKKLLEEGIDPNYIEDSACITPLHYAAQNDCLEAAMVLICVGDDINRVTQDGYTVLDVAKLHGAKRVVEFLTKIQGLPA